MASKRQNPAARSSSLESTPAVSAFMATLDHPFKREIEAIRQVILGAHPGIGEGIKWNAPSFRTTEYFATINLRAKGGVGVIFHLGAKVRDIPAGGMPMEDPTRMLEWVAKDRAIATFTDLKDVGARKAALEGIVRQWVSQV